MNKPCLSCRHFAPTRPGADWGLCTLKLPPKVQIKWPQDSFCGAQNTCTFHEKPPQQEKRTGRRSKKAAARDAAAEAAKDDE